MIEIIDLHKSFDTLKVLKGVNLSIAEKEVIAIIGKSGCGKSVLIKHIIGLLTPDRGRILINGVDITAVSEKELDKIRNKLGVVFQGGALFDSMTVFENVAFPLKEKTRMGKQEIRERVLKALEDVGLRGAENKYPSEISGGMRKRVSLARALITEPDIIIFDEPSTGLDPIILHAIHRLIIDMHKKYNFTGVVISHEIPEIFDVADRIAMMHDGIIAEVGTPSEIKESTNPVVRQFITGSLEGPIDIF